MENREGRMVAQLQIPHQYRPTEMMIQIPRHYRLEEMMRMAVGEEEMMRMAAEGEECRPTKMMRMAVEGEEQLVFISENLFVIPQLMILCNT